MSVIHTTKQSIASSELLSVIKELGKILKSTGPYSNGKRYAQGGIVKSTVKKMERMGRHGDTILAHINPEEARILKAMGGRGTINPRTGLREFWKPDGKGGWIKEQGDDENTRPSYPSAINNQEESKTFSEQNNQQKLQKNISKNIPRTITEKQEELKEYQEENQQEKEARRRAKELRDLRHANKYGRGLYNGELFYHENCKGLHSIKGIEDKKCGNWDQYSHQAFDSENTNRPGHRILKSYKHIDKTRGIPENERDYRHLGATEYNSPQRKTMEEKRNDRISRHKIEDDNINLALGTNAQYGIHNDIDEYNNERKNLINERKNLKEEIEEGDNNKELRRKDRDFIRKTYNTRAANFIRKSKKEPHNYEYYQTLAEDNIVKGRKGGFKGFKDSPLLGNEDFPERSLTPRTPTNNLIENMYEKEYQKELEKLNKLPRKQHTKSRKQSVIEGMDQEEHKRKVELENEIQQQQQRQQKIGLNVSSSKNKGSASANRRLKDAFYQQNQQDFNQFNQSDIRQGSKQKRRDVSSNINGQFNQMPQNMNTSQQPQYQQQMSYNHFGGLNPSQFTGPIRSQQLVYNQPHVIENKAQKTKKEGSSKFSLPGIKKQ